MDSIFQKRGIGYIAAVLGIAAVTAVCAPFHDQLNDTTVALALLMVVLFVATLWGSWPALIASALGVLCFNFFFLPPVYTLTIADPRNWVALTSFLITAITAGQLSELAKRRAAEAETVKKEARLRTAYQRSLLEASLDPLVTIGSDGKINDVNSAIEVVTGRSRVELIGTDFSKYFTEPERARTGYQQALSDGFVRDYALELRHRDGHVTSVLYNASLYRDDSGKVIGVVAATRPISTSAGEPVSAMSAPGVVKGLNRFTAFTSLFSVAVGLLALIGWAFGIAVLKSVIPGQVIIKPNAAVCLVLIGFSLWLLRKKDARPFPSLKKLGAQSLAAIVALVGLLALTEHIFGWGLGIDQLLFRDENPWEAFGSVRPGLIAPITALDFLLLGLALIMLDWTTTWKSRRIWPAQFLALVAGISSIVGLLDFVFESHTSYTHIALQTAVTLFLLCCGLVCARSERGLAALLASPSFGGALTRRLAPAAVIIPMVIGTLAWRIYAAGLSSEWGSGALMTVAMIILLGGLTVWNGYIIDRSDSEQRKAEGSLRRREEELREAQRLARVGSWWWDPRADSVGWSEGLYRISGRDPKLPPPSYKEQSLFYTPESIARLNAAVEKATQTGAPYALELEMVRADGAIRSVTSRGEAERGADGQVTLVRGSVHDVTEHKQAEEALRESEANLNRAQEIAHIGSWCLDLPHNRLIWSDEVFRIFGIPKGTALTYEVFLGAVHPEDRENANKAWAAALRGAPYDIEHRIVVDGALKWVREMAKVEFDNAGNAVEGIGTVQDITERKRAEVELLRANRAHRALSRCNETLIRATDEATLLEQICRIIVDEAGYSFCWVGRAEQDDAKTVSPIAHAGIDEGYLKTANITWADAERGRGPTGTSIRTGQTQVVKDIAADPRLVPWRAEALKRGYASIIAIPLLVAPEPFGALTIYSSETEAFRDEELSLLSELAGDLSYGIAALRTRAERKRAGEEIRKLNAELEQRVIARTAELQTANKLKDELLLREQAASAELAQAHDREIEVGYRIQQTLLLDQPPKDISGLRVAALTIPSQRIDGDFYVFFKHPDQRLDVIVGDVMGKGVPAALLGAATKSHFIEALSHLTALSRDGKLPEPKEIVTLAHAEVARHLINLESFVTLCYVRLDLDRRNLVLVDCGHTALIRLRRKTGQCELVRGDNLPLGVREGEIYDQICLPFEPGDVLIFYSDGITEARNSAGELFGVDRLTECVRINRDLEPEALVEAIRQAAFTFSGADRLTDDLTCVVVKAVEKQAPLARAEIELRSDLKELGRSRQFVRAFCRDLPGAPLDEESVGKLELAVTEACSNIMKHAYHGRADQWIHLEAEAVPGSVSIRLHHLGDSFDPSKVPPPALDGSQMSGFGMYLITRSVDEVSYYRDERGRNCIALVKARKSSHEGETDGNNR
jgi:PAS domain S-box-containing protein